MKRRLPTLRARIVVASAVSTLVVLLGVGGLVLAGARRDERAALDGRLQARANQLQAAAALDRLGQAAGIPAPLGGALLSINETGVRVIHRGTLVQALGDVPADQSLHLPRRAGLRTFRSGAGERWRAATVRVQGRPGMFVEVLSPLSTIQTSVRALRRRIVLVGLIGMLVAIALATAASNYAVRSLGRLRSAADEVAETERLDLRIPEDGPAEVHAVAHALNAMLTRLEQSSTERERALAATKQFAADAGHELRTPLAVLQTGLETLARNPDLPEAERSEIVAETLAEHHRLAELVVALQALTRGDGGAMGDETELDLRDIAQASVRQLQRERPAVTLSIDVGSAPASIVASPAGVRLLVDNLLQNAARHGAAPGESPVVRVAVRRVGPGVELVVEDDGPGVPDADRARITERFVRGSTAVGDGSGLGLAIVEQQVRRLGGDLVVGRSASGGARFTATLHAVAATAVTDAGERSR